MNDDWLNIQQKYWEQWTDMGRKAMGADLPKTTPWEGAMDHWWKAMAPAAPDMSRDVVERMMDQGKMFFRMADTFTRNLSTAGGTGGDGWQSVSHALDEMQKSFTAGFGEGDTAINKMLAFWELPYDNWQRMASSLSPMPGDLLRNMPHDPLKDSLNRVLSAPGLGYAREEQSQYQDLMRRTLDYQKVLQEYTAFFSHLGVKATERMRDTLVDMQQSDKAIDSARGLYDTWVGCCESVYAEEVQSAEYARIHGELVNAQMAFKQRMSIIVDESLGALNMPTRSELRTLQDRLQETRRENKALRKGLDSLEKQVAALVGDAAADTQTPRPAPASAARRPSPPRKKAAVRKKTAAKPADE